MTGFDILQYFKDTPIAEAEQALGFATDLVRSRKRPGGGNGGSGGRARPSRAKPGMPGAGETAGQLAPATRSTGESTASSSAPPPSGNGTPSLSTEAPKAGRRRRAPRAAVPAEPLIPDTPATPAPAPLASVGAVAQGEVDGTDPEAPVA